MRQSNIELLRISAMMLVLIVHAAFFTFGWPTPDTIQQSPLEQTLMTVAEAMAIICVNVFVLISGWFGIRPTVKSLSKFLFQVFFFLFGIYAVMLIIGKAQFSIKGLLECCTITNWNWFIKAYLALYLISPFLNAFGEKADRRTVKWVLISFFVLQTVYGWAVGTPNYASGYSTLSFIGLYLLARYFKIYRPKFTLHNKGFYLGVYFLCVAFLVALTIIPGLYMKGGYASVLISRLYNYVCPIVIVEACAYFFVFERFTPPRQVRLLPINQAVGVDLSIG